MKMLFPSTNGDLTLDACVVHESAHSQFWLFLALLFVFVFAASPGARALPSCNPQDYQTQVTDGSKDYIESSGDVVIATPLRVTEPGGMTISTPDRIVIFGGVFMGDYQSLTLTGGSIDQIDCYPKNPTACDNTGYPNEGNGASIHGGTLILNVGTGGVGLNSCPFKQLITQDINFIHVVAPSSKETACLFIGRHLRRAKRTQVEIEIEISGLFGAPLQPALVHELSLDDSHAWIGPGFQECGTTSWTPSKAAQAN